jgi:hypothetical protein
MARVTTEHASSSVWARAMRVAREEGIKGVILRIVDRGKSEFKFQLYYLLAYPLNANGIPLKTRTPTQVEIISPEDETTIRELVSIYGVSTTEKDILNRLRKKDDCYISRVDGRIAGYIWINYRDKVVTDRGKTIYTIHPDEVYLYDAYVVPEQRGKEIYPLLTEVAGQKIAQQFGKKRIVLDVLYHNTASLNASRKLGQQHIGWLFAGKAFGKRFTFVLPLPARRL